MAAVVKMLAAMLPDGEGEGEGKGKGEGEAALALSSGEEVEVGMGTEGDEGGRKRKGMSMGRERVEVGGVRRGESVALVMTATLLGSTWVPLQGVVWGGVWNVHWSVLEAI